jgi:hypothetical protein
MPLGPGKYDDLCTYVRRQAKADGAVVIVLNGNKGHGFSVQADLMSTVLLPELLETLAADIRKSHGKGKA